MVIVLVLLAPIVGVLLARMGFIPENTKIPQITGRDLTAVTDPEKKLVNTFITELSATPTPTTAPIAHGKQTFFVRSGNAVGPKISQVDISELDPKAGSEQSFTVFVGPVQNVPISSVSVALKTDTQVSNYALTRTGQSDGQDIWNATWKVKDTHNKIYTAVVQATDVNGKATIEITVR